MNKSTEQVLIHHLTAFGSNNLDALMQDYTEGSILLTPKGKVSGLKAIRQFFAELFTVIPTGSAFTMKQKIVAGEIAYIFWESESELFKISFGTDTYVIENGKIKYQTVTDNRIAK